MEDDKLPLINWSLVVIPKENPDYETQTNNISLDLSLSLSSSISSSSTTSTYDKAREQEETHYKKLETIDFFVEKSSVAFDQSKPSETDAKIPLELSLCAFDNMSSDTTTTDYKGKQAIMCMEKGSSALSSSDSDSDANDDISLALSLSLNPRFEFGEGSNHPNLKPNDALITSKKRKTLMGNSPNRKYKRSKVETVSTELRLGHDPWSIKKKLFKSDIGNMSRLILPSNLVKAHILPHWNADQKAQIEQGLPVLVWDRDTNTEHNMTFKRWNNGANVLIQNWIPAFVERRELQERDEIGLYWDIQSSRFIFSVLSRAPRQ